jgi:hypothetical protein
MPIICFSARCRFDAAFAIFMPDASVPPALYAVIAAAFEAITLPLKIAAAAGRRDSRRRRWPIRWLDFCQPLISSLAAFSWPGGCAIAASLSLAFTIDASDFLLSFLPKLFDCRRLRRLQPEKAPLSIVFISGER